MTNPRGRMPVPSSPEKPSWRQDGPLSADEAAADAVLAAVRGATSIRETIDLLEFDLSAMIRDVAGAAAAVRGGASASAQSLAAIRARTETLAAKSHDAKRD